MKNDFSDDYLGNGGNIYLDNDQKTFFEGILKILDPSFNL